MKNQKLFEATSQYAPSLSGWVQRRAPDDPAEQVRIIWVNYTLDPFPGYPLSPKDEEHLISLLRIHNPCRA